MRATRRFQRALMALVLSVSLMAPAANALAEHPAKATPAAAQEVRCPVMGELVKDPATASKSEYKGKTYYFCCPACKPKFDADPEKYVGKPAPAKPMHSPEHGSGEPHHKH